MAGRRSHSPQDSDDGGGDDSDPEFDDGESEDIEVSDRARLSHETAYCPDCGAEIYDAADVCPKCFAWIDGETVRRPPGGLRHSGRWKSVVIWTLVLAMTLGAGLLWALVVGFHAVSRR